MANSRLEKKIAYVARAFVWESRFQRARQVYRTVKTHKQTAREAKEAVSWWARLLLPSRDED